MQQNQSLKELTLCIFDSQGNEAYMVFCTTFFIIDSCCRVCNLYTPSIGCRYSHHLLYGKSWLANKPLLSDSFPMQYFLVVYHRQVICLFLMTIFCVPCPMVAMLLFEIEASFRGLQ